MMESAAMRMMCEFHAKFGVVVNDRPTVPDEETRLLRVKLIVEEADEFAKATAEEDIVEAADALADLLYVVYGAALTWGVPVDRVFAEVHRSNMTKVWDDGTVHRREDGKILKPPTYSPADVRSALKG